MTCNFWVPNSSQAWLIYSITLEMFSSFCDKFSLNWILGENLFLFLSAVQKGLGVFSNTFPSHFLIFSFFLTAAKFSHFAEFNTISKCINYAIFQLIYCTFGFIFKEFLSKCICFSLLL